MIINWCWLLYPVVMIIIIIISSFWDRVLYSLGWPCRWGSPWVPHLPPQESGWQVDAPIPILSRYCRVLLGVESFQTVGEAFDGFYCQRDTTENHLGKVFAGVFYLRSSRWPRCGGLPGKSANVGLSYLILLAHMWGIVLITLTNMRRPT